MSRCYLFIIILCFGLTSSVKAQNKTLLISKEDLTFLSGMTRSVMDSSRISPGQVMPVPYGKNNTGGILIRPGGRETYPSFWIRDYAMSLETGFVKPEEQRHMLWLTASTQCDQTWITKGGSMIPFGSIADHIRVDNSLPIFFPGTYDYEGQGTTEFGTFPAYCDQFYFIDMAEYYVRTTADLKFLLKQVNGTRLLDRLENAFAMPPARNDTHLVFTTDAFRGVDFGFRDAIAITGELAYASILKWRAALQLSLLFDKLKDQQKSAKYKKIANSIKSAMPKFINENGMLKASDARSAQADVWATAYAVHLGLLNKEQSLNAAKHLNDAYSKGNLAYKGAIRHIIKGEDFNESTAWETAIVPRNQYQNGAYWGTPTGWVSETISLVNPASAARLISEYINELRQSDYRKGKNFGGPFECFYPPDYYRGPVYLTTVSCPYIVFKSLDK